MMRNYAKPKAGNTVAPHSESKRSARALQKIFEQGDKLLSLRGIIV